MTGCFCDRKGFAASEGTFVWLTEVSSGLAMGSEDEVLSGVIAGAGKALLLKLDCGGGG